MTGELKPKFINKTKKFNGYVFTAMYFDKRWEGAKREQTRLIHAGYRARIQKGRVMTVSYHAMTKRSFHVLDEAYIVYARRK